MSSRYSDRLCTDSHGKRCKHRSRFFGWKVAYVIAVVRAGFVLIFQIIVYLIPVEKDSDEEAHPSAQNERTVQRMVWNTNNRRSTPVFAPGCIGLARRTRTMMLARHQKMERPKGMKVITRTSKIFVAASMTIAMKSKTMIMMRIMNLIFHRGSAATTSARLPAEDSMEGFIVKF